MACSDSGATENIAAIEYGDEYGTRNYAKPLAEELPKSSCEGAKGLTDDTRASLRDLVSATAIP
jgi:hypothetical protein